MSLIWSSLVLMGLEWQIWGETAHVVVLGLKTVQHLCLLIERVHPCESLMGAVKAVMCPRITVFCFYTLLLGPTDSEGS